MKLSVVILNYNVRYFLELCLRSVQEALKNIEAEIIVVDNRSEDTSCQMVKELFPTAILVENRENYGFSKGNNMGVSRAQGEYICILNPDTVVPEDVFEKLLAFAQEKENLGIVGCKLINGRGDFLPESKRNVPFVKAAIKKLVGNPEDYYATHLKDDETGKVDVLVGAFMFMKRSLFNDIKGFDEDYFMYGEDIDLSYKVLKAGFSNYYYGAAKVIHFKGESTLRDKFYLKRFYGAMQIFYEKHFKKNPLFNILVWAGIKGVYLMRKPTVAKKAPVERYLVVSNKLDTGLRTALTKETILKPNLMEKVPQHTQIILDGHVLSFKKMIELIEQTPVHKTVTYKIFPKDCKFIIGSDNTISRGQIIKFHEDKL